MTAPYCSNKVAHNDDVHKLIFTTISVREFGVDGRNLSSIKCCSEVGSIPALYYRGPGFKSHPRDWFSGDFCLFHILSRIVLW